MDKTDVIDVPLMSRSAPVDQVDKETRTVRLVWSTGAQVKRYDWLRDRPYLEELSIDPGAVRMDRLKSGRAPLLDSHQSWDLSKILGVVRSADIEDGKGVALVEFSEREDVEPVYQDVVKRIIGNVSVGYQVHAIEMIPPEKEGDLWIYRAIDWEPTEISMVSVGADAGSGTDIGIRSNYGTAAERHQNRVMPCKVITRNYENTQNERKGNTMGTTVPQNNDASNEDGINNAALQRQLEDARLAGIKAEAERQNGIRSAVRMGGLDDAFAEQLLARSDMTIADAGMAVLTELSKRDAGTPTRSPANIVTTSDQTENRRSAMGDAIVLRANPQPNFAKDGKRLDAAHQYRGMTLIDMAKECIELAGGNTRGMSRNEVAKAALNMDSGMRTRAGMQTTSDFPEILGNTVGRTLREMYQQQPRTFVGFTRRATAPDFKQVARVQMSEAAKFRQINEGGEYKVMSFGESAEKYALSKYGNIIAITWETLVNDDLSAFDRIPLALAAEAAAIEGDIVYGILTGNPNMSDGKSLFSADHANVSATGSAITDISLSSSRAAMRKQVGLKGRILNLTPKYLIVGPDNEGAANKYTSASFVAAKASDINPNFNTSLEVIVDARIQGNSWFQAADPTMIDTIEYMYLEGEEGLFTETKQGFEVDGLMIKARHVFAAKAIDYRGLYKNGGAS